jgi:uncharacterized membrane protein YphA (DoxX/SURF4 family)
MGWRTIALRIILAGALAATLQQTWPLWGPRSEPPLLPLVPWPESIPFGVLMIATATTFVVWPRAGLAAHVLVGLAAMTADQTRMQPQIFSLWLMMLGTVPTPTAQFVGRCHLASLWCFSGLHKLLSPGYYRDVAPFLWSGLFSAEMRASLPNGAVPTAAALAVVEMLLGLAVFVPRWRRTLAVVVVVLHVGILWILHRHNNWNTSVWPWNAALASVGAALIATWRRSLVDELRTCGRAGFAMGAALFFSPLLFYVGLLDPYLCHCLYSSNVPTAVMQPAAVGAKPYQMNALEGPYWQNVNAPQPPAHRIFEQYFRAVARSGDVMVVEDPRLWAVWTGYDRYAWRHLGTKIDRMPLPESR